MNEAEARKINKAIYFAKKAAEIESKLRGFPEPARTALAMMMKENILYQCTQTPADIFSSDSASIDAKRARKQRVKQVKTELPLGTISGVEVAQ